MDLHRRPYLRCLLSHLIIIVPIVCNRNIPSFWYRRLTLYENRQSGPTPKPKTPKHICPLWKSAHCKLLRLGTLCLLKRKEGREGKSYLLSGPPSHQPLSPYLPESPWLDLKGCRPTALQRRELLPILNENMWVVFLAWLWDSWGTNSKGTEGGLISSYNNSTLHADSVGGQSLK